LDWLFGRPASTVPVAPYTPVIYQDPNVPVTTLPQPVATNGVVQSQRPAYGYGMPQTYQNPSVYTGLPVDNSAQVYAQRLPITSPAPPVTNMWSAQAPYTPPPIPTSNWSGAPIGLPNTAVNRVPIASTLRGTAAVNPIAVAPTYSANYPSAVAPVGYNAPQPMYPSQPLPTAAPAQPAFGSGLSRFFNSPLGNNTSYSTSYTQAPITYYRPQTTLNPVTGTTVTVQQPCSSYVQQLQRVPYNTFQPINPGGAAVVPTIVPQPGCQDPCSAPAVAPTYAPLPGTIGQAGGQIVPSSPGVTVMPIPSTAPDAGAMGAGSFGPIAPMSSAPNTMPLTGSSPGAGDPADQQTVPQPELNPNRATLNLPPVPNSTTEETSGYYFNDGLDSDNSATRGGPSHGNGGTPPSAEEPAAITLDPPVAGTPQSNRPLASIGPPPTFATQTPPSLESSASTSYGNQPAPIPMTPTYSTIRPIGAPEDADPQTTPSVGAIPNPAGPVLGGTTDPMPNPDVLEPPPLPNPSNRAADPSALFRNTETSASSRYYPPQNRVSVPIREATTRQQSVRQVAAWEELRQRPATEVQPLRSPPRDSGGWLPIQ
jgi:hypothetical protein